MSGINGIGNIPGTNGVNFSGPVSAATALAALRRHGVTSVEITDTVQNIAKNMTALQAYSTKITALATDDASKQMVLTGTQYQKSRDLVALWGTGAGQTVELKGALASAATGLASCVTSMSVSDSSVNIQRYLDQLQTLSSSGVLSEITQTGTPSNITLTSAQLTADQDALNKIRNQAYSLAITNATVSDVLGQGATPALASNSKVRTIAIVDTTDNIGDNLDALQGVGLRIKSIAQTDAATHLEITGDQYSQDKLVLGKIITSDLLDVMDVSVAQLRTLATDHKVVTVDIKDQSANLSRNWALLSRLEDSLTSVEVSDQTNAIRLTADQLSSGSTLLTKFTDTVDHSYKLAVTSVSAGSALAVAGTHNVDTIDVLDNSANVTANLTDLQTINGQGKLNTITVSGSGLLSMDISHLQGAELASTQAVLDKIKGHNYTLSVSGMTTLSVADLASNKRVVSMAITDSSDNLESALGTLSSLGGRIKTINQSDAGSALDLTQTQMISYGAVLAKITGGYLANLSGVSAAKATAYAHNTHIGNVAVSDTGRNIMAHWSDLLALGNNLDSISQSDLGALSVTASNYQTGLGSSLVGKFGGGTTFSVTAASLVQAQALSSDNKVTRMELSEESGVIAENMASLETLAAAGKLTSIINQTPNESLALDAGELAPGQAVLDLIKGGSYSLAVSGVDVADAKDLLAANRKIASLAVTGVGADIVSNLSDLSTLGRRVATITQSDAPSHTLDMTGEAFQRNATTLAKIQGGYLAVLSDVSAAKVATFADSGNVSSMTVADTGSHLAGAWAALNKVGVKLTEVTQSDSTTLHLDANDWLHTQELRDKFHSDPTVSLSNANISQVATLASYDEVESVQVADSASALSGALEDLAGEAKISGLTLTDASVAMTMTAQAYSDHAALLSLVSNSGYQVELKDVAAADVASLASDTHVSLMDVKDTAAEFSANFDDLAAADNVNSIELSDVDQTVTLTANQILGKSSTLDKVTGSYNLAATDVAMIDLTAIQDVPQTASIAIKDTSDNVSAFFSDVLALGDTLTEIQFTNSSPALSLSEDDWTTGVTALATVAGSYEVDVTDVVAGNAQTVADDTSVRNLAVNDTAGSVASNWDTLVSLYNAGSGKLNGISVNDSTPLILTAAQQTAGADMIADLLADQTIEIVG
jgi:hypothetical protein